MRVGRRTRPVYDRAVQGEGREAAMRGRETVGRMALAAAELERLFPIANRIVLADRDTVSTQIAGVAVHFLVAERPCRTFLDACMTRRAPGFVRLNCSRDPEPMADPVGETLNRAGRAEKIAESAAPLHENTEDKKPKYKG